MTLDGHLKVGLSSAIFSVFAFHGISIEMQLVLAISLFVGNVFPDFSEMGIIPHRTYTHYWPFYVALFLAAYWFPGVMPEMWMYTIMGVSAGALTHIVCDWPYYGGVPLLTPTHKIPLFQIEFGGLSNRVIEHTVVLAILLCTLSVVFMEPGTTPLDVVDFELFNNKGV